MAVFWSRGGCRGRGGVAHGLASDAGSNAWEGGAAAFGDGFAAFDAMGGGGAGGLGLEDGAGAGDGILDGVVDLVGDGAVGGPVCGYGRGVMWKQS